MGSATALALVMGAALPAFADPDAALAKLQETVLSKGPSGEDPSPASDVVLSDEELAKIKEMGATAAIVMHYGGNDWSRAQINGLQTQFAAMGIEVIAVTDAGFKPEKQVSDLETIMAQSPDIIVSIPTDPTATAAAPRMRPVPRWCSWTTFRPPLCRKRIMSRSSRRRTMATALRQPI
jgi:ribose transport system substrate-binding protein